LREKYEESNEKKGKCERGRNVKEKENGTIISK
jgi:hypothetical protein